MATYIDPKCEKHPNPKDCEDALVAYDARFDSYAFYARMGANWVTRILFCPWCGDPKRDLSEQYYTALDELGVDPAQGNVPEKFQSNKWWKEKSL
jgi:hypothetical protein